MEATENRVYTLTIGNTVIENIRIIRMDENALLADSPAGIIRLQWREEPQIDRLLPMPTLERIVSAAVAQCADDPLLQGRLEEIAALMQRNEREPLTAAMEQLQALRRRREVQLLIGKCACMLGDYRTAVREWNSACPIPAYAARAAWEARCMPLCQLLTAIIIRIIHVGIKSGNYMNRLICVGIAGMLTAQVFINIGVCIGLVPVIGLTLPFFSYGGSSLVTMFFAMGIVSGINMRPAPDSNARYIRPPLSAA